MLTLTHAREVIAEQLRPLPPRRVALAEACGRTVAEDITADGNFPADDRAMMDGYVVAADAVPGVFEVVGELPAGSVPTRPLGPGEAMRIFTGAVVPAGGGRVIMQEEAVREGDCVRFDAFSEKMFIRPRGSEAVPGQTVLAGGTRLGAAELAILAQVGAVAPLVTPAPSVHHVATGDELVDAAVSPAPGQIRDSNSMLLRALCGGFGVGVFTSRRTGDDRDALGEAAATDSDVLLISGGASVGAHDFGAATLRGLGYTIHFDRVNLRPGKPLTFATRGAQAAFVLPGNPVSHFVCFHLGVRLALETVSGQTPRWSPVWIDLDASQPLTPDPRETWWPAVVTVTAGRFLVTPLRWTTSADTFSLAGVNALVLVNATSPAAGRALTLLLP